MTEQDKLQVERINELSATARTSWLALLAFLAYIGITLLAVEDADFFVPSRRTELPLVGISIPTFSFFLFAPPLAAALYIYLHIHLLRLWDALADAPATIDGQPLGEHLHPWIAKDYALGLRCGGALRPRPLRVLGDLASLLLVWAAGPAVLAFFWWRSATAHADLLTLAIAVSFFLALRAGLISLWHLRARMMRRGWGDPWDGRRWKAPLLWLVAVLLVVVGWLRTEAGLDHYLNHAIDFWEAASARQVFDPGTYPNGDTKDPQTVQEEWVTTRSWVPTLDDTFTFTSGTFPFSWTPLAPIDLAGADLVPLPPDWRTPETARHAFRHAWCQREGLEMAVCDHPESADHPLPDHVNPLRRGWCDREDAGEAVAPFYAGEDCDTFFADVDERFEAAWEEERDAAVASRDRVDLAGLDLRGADALGASMVGADLSGARLQGANLVGARLEGANLVEARMEGANLLGARLQGAELLGARLQGANLMDAQLQGAVLTLARLEGADLREARLEGANLGGVRLEGANLMWAWLEGPDFMRESLNEALFIMLWSGVPAYQYSRGARLGGTDLRYADLRESKWAGASIGPSLAQFADFRGARDLTQAQLEDLIGNADTLVPDRPSDAGAPFYVWSCWQEPPPDLDRIIAAGSLGDAGSAALRATFLCGPDNPRRKTGTPCPVDLPREECRTWAVARRLVGQD
jgi:uncharacterized protein YjbI with pentapeptide repeats